MATVNDILMMIVPRQLDLGGVVVSRILPSSKKRMVGPFIFLDHLPAHHFQPGTGMDVRPHPHIGLSTLSYIRRGQAIHRDSLGNEQILKAGDVNWMTAGKGIVHSERIPQEVKNHEYDFELLQFWIALPKSEEERNPSFTHYDKKSIPDFQVDGADITLIAGEAFGRRSPVEVFSKLFFFSVTLKKGESFTFDPGPDQEAGLYRLDGRIRLGERVVEGNHFAIFSRASKVQVEALEDSSFVLFGGEPFPEPRFIFWNFVSSSEERIDRATEDWRAQRFPKVIHETEFIPLPENTRPLSKPLPKSSLK
jgi:redox-sensitive bicupin YhaK (pirin superfamily)